MHDTERDAEVVVGETIPALLPFVTFRRERFGGLLFNPYLGLEEELNPIEAHAVALVDGRNAESQVVAELRRHFGLAASKARNRYAALHRRLTAAMMLDERTGRAPPRPTLPDTPTFPEDGPYYAAPKDAVWDLTHACNLRCGHCLTDSGSHRSDELDTEQCLALARRLADAQVLRISLSGGEPTLREDFSTIVRHLTDANLRVDVASNGYDLPDRVLDELRNLDLFQVQISIDGEEGRHDRLRGVAGAHRRSRRSIERLRAMGMAVAVSMTVTADNIEDIDAAIDLARETGCVAFKAIGFMPAGRGRHHQDHLALNADGQRRFAEIIARRSKELAGVMQIATETTFAFLLDRPPPESCGDGRMGCSAGYDTLSIGPDGTAYPCPFLQDFPLGQLLDTPLRVLWHRAETLEVLRRIRKRDLGEPCRSCTYSPELCAGGCRAAAYLAHGDLLAADPSCFR